MTALDVPIATSRACRSSSDPPHVPAIKKTSSDSPPARDGTKQLHVIFTVEEEELLLRPVVPHHFLCLRVAQQRRQTNAFTPDGIYSWTCRASYTSQAFPFWENYSDEKRFNLDVRRDVLSQAPPGAPFGRAYQPLEPRARHRKPEPTFFSS